MKKFIVFLSACLFSSTVSSTVISCNINNVFSASSPNLPTFQRVNIPNNYELYTDKQNHASAVYQSIRTEIAQSAKIDVSVFSRSQSLFGKGNKVQYGDDYFNVNIKIFDNNDNLINDISDDAIVNNYDDSTTVFVNEKVKVQISVSKSFYFKPTENSIIFYTTILPLTKNNILPNYTNQQVNATFSCNNALFYISSKIIWYSIDNQHFQQYQNENLDFDQISNIVNNPLNVSQFYFLINHELYLFDSKKQNFDIVFLKKMNITAIAACANDLVILQNHQIQLLSQMINTKLFTNEIKLVNIKSICYNNIDNQNLYLVYASDINKNLYLVKFINNSYTLEIVTGINGIVNDVIEFTNVLRNGNSYNGNNYTYMLINHKVYVSENNVDFYNLNFVNNNNNITQILSTDNCLYVVVNGQLYLYDNYNKFKTIIFSDNYFTDNKIINNLSIVNDNLFYVLSNQNNKLEFYQNLSWIFSNNKGDIN